VQYASGMLLLQDSVIAVPFTIFHERDSVRANAFYPTPSGGGPVSAWSPWTKLVLTGPAPITSQIPFNYSVDTWFEDYMAKAITAINTKAPPGYSGANALIYLFGTQHPVDTTGFWFNKTADHSGQVVVSINGNLTECNVRVNGVTQKFAFSQSYKTVEATFAIVRGVNRFRFYTVGVNCQMKAIAVRWADQTVPVTPLGVGVHR
jgi:hypothetical protein